MTIAASFTPKPAILSFAITHELLTMRLFLDSLANNNFRMKRLFISILMIMVVTAIKAQTVYSCEYTSDAGWKNKSKQHLMY